MTWRGTLIVHGESAASTLTTAGRFLSISLPDGIVGGIRVDLASGENDSDRVYPLAAGNWVARMTVETSSPARLRRAILVLQRNMLVECYADNGEECNWR